MLGCPRCRLVNCWRYFLMRSLLVFKRMNFDELEIVYVEAWLPLAEKKIALICNNISKVHFEYLKALYFPADLCLQRKKIQAEWIIKFLLLFFIFFSPFQFLLLKIGGQNIGKWSILALRLKYCISSPVKLPWSSWHVICAQITSYSFYSDKIFYFFNKTLRLSI